MIVNDPFEFNSSVDMPRDNRKRQESEPPRSGWIATQRGMNLVASIWHNTYTTTHGYSFTSSHFLTLVHTCVVAAAAAGWKQMRNTVQGLINRSPMQWLKQTFTLLDCDICLNSLLYAKVRNLRRDLGTFWTFLGLGFNGRSSQRM